MMVMVVWVMIVWWMGISILTSKFETFKHYRPLDTNMSKYKKQATNLAVESCK